MSQLSRDNALLIAILNFIGPGSLYTQFKSVSRIRISNINVIQHNVLPFFYHNPFPVNSFKSIQYNHWLIAVETLIKNKNYSKNREQVLTQQLKTLSNLKNLWHYTPNVDLAFVSVEHIMRDVNYGWLMRYIHANVASFFFIFVYGHIGRNLYYGSFKSPRVMPWSIGVIILILIIGIAFLGYYNPIYF